MKKSSDHRSDQTKIQIMPDALIINGASSVAAWEAPIQHALAQCVVEEGAVVLEIGYGLGMAASAIAKRRPSQHWLVECHAEILCGVHGKLAQPFSGVIDARWEDAVLLLRDSSFHAIVFDPDPADRATFDGSAEATFAFVRPFLPEAARLLMPGGRLGFIDFSAEIDRHRGFLDALSAHNFSLQASHISTNAPPECLYARSPMTYIIKLTKWVMPK